MTSAHTLKRTGLIITVLLLAVALMLSAFVMLAATDGPTASNDAPAYSPVNARATLDSVQGRQFPNMIPPRDDIVAAQSAGIAFDGSDVAALDDWYKDFYTRKTKSGPNPIAYQRRMDAIAAAEAQGRSVQATAAETGTAKMLMVAFDFDGTDTFPACDANGASLTATVTITGPLKGDIPNPATTGDNNTLWDPDMDIQWYEDLMFGDGVGVVRTDLNGGAGVDLTGVSAKNWYEEQSEGQYSISGTIHTEWVTLDRSVAWYGWDNGEVAPDGVSYPCDFPDGNASGSGYEFISDIADKVNADNPGFDWAQYDVDGDGIVDHFMVIHAGVDNSAGGGDYGNYQIWAHSWDVYTNFYSGTQIISRTEGYLVQDTDPSTTTDDIYLFNYTVIPEDADIGVVVHEYGHDIGLPDLYDQTGATSNSTAHWIAMSGGSWSGALGGSHPAPFNPWARWFFGWETPKQINYTDSWEGMIGQSEPTPGGTEDSVWINLPDQQVTVDNLAGEGKGLHAMLGNMVVYTLTRSFDLSGATSPVFSFTTDFEIEEDWDYTYIRASVDGGANWDILTNTQGIYATSNPNGSFAWWGPGGLTGSYNGTLNYDLSAYAGQSSVMLQFAYVTDQAVQDPGIWVDNFTLAEIGYSNDLEDSSDWSNVGWEEVPYNKTYPHYYMLEWRNDSGSIAQKGQTEQYYSLAHDQDGWKVDKFSANVPGLLVWYRNNKYTNNQAVAGGREFETPATGPKGELLLVDSHNDAIPWSGGWWDAGQLSNRRAAMDGAFSVGATPAWMIHDEANVLSATLDFGSRPAVSAFRDSQRSVPGWVFVSPFVYRVDRSASVVIPAEGDYTTRIRSLDTNGNPGADLTSFWGFTVGGQELGSGNPGDSNVQYGVNVEVVSQAGDGSYGMIRISNQKVEFNHSVDPSSIDMTGVGAYTVTYTSVVSNSGNSTANDVAITYTLDSALTIISIDAVGDHVGTPSLPIGTVSLPMVKWWTDILDPGDMVTVTVVATGTTHVGGGTLGMGGSVNLNTVVASTDGLVNQTPVNLGTAVNTPEITITKPQSGTIGYVGTGNLPILVEVDISSFFAVTGDGHWLLQVDGGTDAHIMTYTTSITLTPGAHTLKATLVDPGSTPLGPYDTINVNVGPVSTLYLPLVMKNN